jgi:DinB superfamily
MESCQIKILNLKIMNRQEIINKLKENHQTFVDYILSLSDDEFLYCRPEKWNAGQQLDHINRSVSPLNMAFNLPDFALTLIFGKANRPSKTYEGLVKKYQDKLKTGYQASGRFIPKPIGLSQRLPLAQSLIKKVSKICDQVESYSEQDLDLLILPHPLLGKLTIREMLYFTCYHAEHHQQIAKRNLEGKTT